MSTIVRLTKFHELNVRSRSRHTHMDNVDLTVHIQSIRVFFRLLFSVSLFILSVDGLRPHQHINETMYVPKFLL